MACSDLGPISLRVISESSKVKGQEVIKVHGADNSLQNLIMSISDKQEETEPFYVLDLGVILRVMEKWNQSLPNVKPYYAVKCNTEPAVLIALATLGANFNCSSQTDIQAVIELGISPDRILYANPCKSVSHIKYAARVGVNLATFDSKDELDKIIKWHPQCGLLIRIDVSNEKSSLLSTKYGAFQGEIVPLLEYAHQAGLKVLGVSFHVGHKSLYEQAYRRAIAAAKSAFDAASELKMPPMTILNIGGGFQACPLFDDLAVAVKELIQEYFPDENSIKVIAEPGRFIVETAFTMVTNVIGKRVRGDQIQYWIDDGIHGSFNVTVYDCSSMNFKPLFRNGDSSRLLSTSSIVFGPTCYSGDIVVNKCKLPELQVNDLLVFYNMGAYTTCLGSKFNGYSRFDIPTYLVYST